jgi:SpoVK/Ycf46/Vps4 family AAA+-type ATPase
MTTIRPAIATAAAAAMTAAFQPRRPSHALDELVLPARTLEAILEALAVRENQDLVFDSWGLSATHGRARRIGINLYGPPGTGKTMAAHAIAARLGMDILPVSYAEIESKFVGDTPKNLGVVFALAREAGCVLFFDEADAILSRRLSNMGNATDTSVNQTRSVLLTLLNDYEGVVLFATNFITNYDPAFMRRMLAHIRFDLPDLECRRRLLAALLPAALPTDARREELALASEGLSGADLSNAVLLAALRGARGAPPFVSHEYFLDAMAGIRAGILANSGDAP